jgi:two-component system alkaline phosphatase synthesis response regulator PhoP
MPSPRVVLVEDDEMSAELVRFLVKRQGFEFAHVADGQKALDMLISQEPPSAIILDWLLPFVDGMVVLEAIRQSPRWSHVPVLVLTGKTREEDIVKALDAGANDFIAKPFQPAELAARLKRIVRVTP